jgi:hypothetical protein
MRQATPIYAGDTMPATLEEVQDIARILSRYLPLDKANQLVVDLDKEIGERTDNDSLSTTLRMLRTHLDEMEEESFPGRQSVHSIKGNDGLRTYADTNR